MTGRINAFRSAVVSAIAAIVPQAKVEDQFGRFDLDELERTSIKCPCVRVAVLSGKVPAVASGQSEGALKCAAFVVTDGKDRDAAAWNIAEAIATLMHSGQMWGLTRLGVPQAVLIQPVISGAIRDRGIVIMAVEWSQSLKQLGQNLFDPEGVMLTELYVNGEEIDLSGGDDGQA